MRFPTIFRRRVGMPPDPVPQSWLQQEAKFIPDAGDWTRYLVPELGSDARPASGERPPRRDNLHESRLVNTNGFPSQRVVVGYVGPEGAPPLLADLYLFDETSGAWFRVPSPSGGVLTPGELSYFDPPCLLDHSRAKRNADDESHQSGSLEVLLVVRAKSPPAGEDLAERLDVVQWPPRGVYTFVVGTDVSNPG